MGGVRGPVMGIIKVLFQSLAPRAAVRYKLTKKAHSEPELELLQDLVDPLQEAIDVGANLGVYTARLVRISTHVHAFEPHPRLARALKAEFNDRATVYHAAVSDKPGQVSLFVPSVAGYSYEEEASVEHVANRNAGRSFVVSACILDQFVGRRIGFVKVDVEGHEASVLAGARELIDTQRPIFLVEAEEQYRPNAVSDLIQFFGHRNYIGSFVDSCGLRSVREFRPEMQDLDRIGNRERGCELWYINNFIFIPRERWSEARHARLARLAENAAGLHRQ